MPPLTATVSVDVEIVETSSPRLTQVHPVPSSIVLSPGESIGLSAIAFDQQGRELSQVTTNWLVADPRAGTITPSGVFRAGFTRGTFDAAIVVIARSPGRTGPSLVQATATVTVEQFRRSLQPSSIRVFPDSAEVEPQETLRLVAMAVDANGVAIPDMKFNWEILEPMVGSVTQDGSFTAGQAIGSFPKSLRVTLAPEQAGGRGALSTNVDISVMDPTSILRRITTTVLPQVISLKPGQRMKFTTLILDQRGNPVTPLEPRWDILDPGAGGLSPDGQFTAGEVPGIYADAVQVSMGVPGTEERLSATGTVIVIDPIPSNNPLLVLPRVVLSPGESARVSIIGLQGDVADVTTANVNWSLTPPEVGEVSRFVVVTAHDYPGIYENAIRAEVIQQTESGPVAQTVSATLVIRGPLAKVEVTPPVISLALGERMQPRALAYDRNDILLSDVSFKWSVADAEAGSMDSNGVFTAEGRPGRYPGAIEVTAIQRQAPPRR